MNESRMEGYTNQDQTEWTKIEFDKVDYMNKLYERALRVYCELSEDESYGFRLKIIGLDDTKDFECLLDVEMYIYQIETAIMELSKGIATAF